MLRKSKLALRLESAPPTWENLRKKAMTAYYDGLREIFGPRHAEELFPFAQLAFIELPDGAGYDVDISTADVHAYFDRVRARKRAVMEALGEAPAANPFGH